MDFTNQINWYYNVESKHAFTVGFLSGSIITLAALAFLKYSSSGSMLRGVSIILLAGGLLFAVGGYFAGSTAKKSLPEKVQQYQTNAKSFVETEYVKVEKIHSSWLGIRIFWSLFLLIGIALIIFTTKPFWLGVSIGALIIGTVGHIEEAISYQHNEKYRNEVRIEKFDSENQP